MSDETARGRTARPSQLRTVAVVAGITAGAALLFDVVGLPSPVMFGAMLAGIVYAVATSEEHQLPPAAYRLGQALVGVVIGAGVSMDALVAMGDDLVSIALVTMGTIVISVLAGQTLSLRRDVSRVTGTFAMIAGGASGVVALARDLGADERVVAVVQYLRVLVVLLTMPLVAAAFFTTEGGDGGIALADPHLLNSLTFVVLSLVLGLVAARLVPSATSTLLAPLVVSAVIASSGWLGDVAVPVPLEWLGFALIGCQVGLRFTPASLRAIFKMLPAVLAILAGMLVATALMGVVLAWLTSADGLTAYLATTPGGLFATLVIAADAGADITFVMAMQLARLIVILLVTPLLASRLRPSRPGELVSWTTNRSTKGRRGRL